MNLRQGIVVDTHPEDNSVDLVMVDDGSRLVGVPVLTKNGSARTGSVDLPDPHTGRRFTSDAAEEGIVGEPGYANKWEIGVQTAENHQIAVVGFMGSNPLVMGFLLPQINEMTFDDRKRSINRHQSDVYHTIDGDGNVELRHPSGAFVRIAEDPRHEKLEQKNFDKSFKQTRNDKRKVRIRLGIGDKFFVEITPDGEVRIHSKTVRFTFDGEGKTATTISEAGVRADGTLVAEGDVKAGPGMVSLRDHVHKGVRAGGDKSKEPPNSDAQALLPNGADKPARPEDVTNEPRPGGGQLAFWPGGPEEGVPVDRFGNVIYEDTDPSDQMVKRWHIRAVGQGVNGAAGGFEGRKIWTDQRGDVLAKKVKVTPDQLVPGQYGGLEYAPPETVDQSEYSPNIDPLPDNTLKLSAYVPPPPDDGDAGGGGFA